MTRSIPISAGVLGWLTPTLALAHPGDHWTMSLAQGMHHLFTEPDHLGMIAAVAAVAAGGWIMRTRRAR